MPTGQPWQLSGETSALVGTYADAKACYGQWPVASGLWPLAMRPRGHEAMRP